MTRTEKSKRTHGAKGRYGQSHRNWISILPDDLSEAEAILHIEERVRVLGSVYKRYRRPTGPLGLGPLALLTAASHSLRVAELANAALRVMQHDQRLAAMTLTRSIFESVAVMTYVNEQLSAIAEGALEISDATHESFRSLLFGMRHRSSGGFTSRNVLTLVDKADKRTKGFRDLYDKLCEYTHPNFPGGLGAFNAGIDSRRIIHLDSTSVGIARRAVIGPLFFACFETLKQASLTDSLVRSARLMNRVQYRQFVSPGKE